VALAPALVVGLADAVGDAQRALPFIIEGLRSKGNAFVTVRQAL
jgi:hypothetical protein